MRKRDALRILKNFKPDDTIHLETKKIIFHGYHGHFVFYHGIDRKEEGILVSFHCYDTADRIKIHFNLIKTFRKTSQEELILRIRHLRRIFAELKEELNRREDI